MSGLVIASNVQSPLLSGLVAVSQEDISYSIKPSAPLMAKNTMIVRSRNAVRGPFDGKEVTIDITRQGFLRELQLRTRFKITTATAGSAADQGDAVQTLQKTPLGLNLFASIDLRTANKVLVSLSDFYIRCRTQESTVNKSIAIYDRALPKLYPSEARLPDDAITSAAPKEVVVYTPVFTCFTEDLITQYFNSRQYEALSISARYNTASRAGFPTVTSTATPTVAAFAIDNESIVTDAIVSVVEYDDRTYKLLLAENSALDRPTQFYGYSSITERVLCKENSNNNDIKINYNFPMTHTYCGLLNGDDTNAGRSLLLPVDSVSIRINGLVLYEDIPTSCMNYEVDQYGGSVGMYPPSGPVANTTVQFMDATKKAIVVRWGVDASRTWCSGAFAMAGTNDVRIYLKTSGVIAATNYIIYSSEVATIINFDNVSSTASVITTS